MDKKLKESQDTNNKLIMTCICEIILGSIIATLCTIEVLSDTETIVLDIIWLVIGILLIYAGIRNIREANEDQYELENMLLDGFETFLDKDLTRIREEIDKITNQLLEEEKKTTKEVE